MAQILFSSRLIIQWFLSERSKKVVTPTIFWVLSLLASIFLFIYGYLRNDFPIMLGQIMAYFIYIRNLQLQGKWQDLLRIIRWFIVLFPVMLLIYSFNNNTLDIQNLFKHNEMSSILFIFGIISQLIFTLRFIYQWLYSEKKGLSILPLGFWLMSLIGSGLILIYAIIRKDPVLFIGHLIGCSIYYRNIVILRKDVKRTSKEG